MVIMIMNLQEQIARIRRMQEETRKFAAEMREAAAPSGLNLFIAGMTAGAALVGATMAAMKALGT